MKAESAVRLSIRRNTTNLLSLNIIHLVLFSSQKSYHNFQQLFGACCWKLWLLKVMVAEKCSTLQYCSKAISLSESFYSIKGFKLSFIAKYKWGLSNFNLTFLLETMIKYLCSFSISLNTKTSLQLSQFFLAIS